MKTKDIVVSMAITMVGTLLASIAWYHWRQRMDRKAAEKLAAAASAAQSNAAAEEVADNE
ncbi:MAG TPA: hypothetical protein PL010_12245 [Flavobacteriales bacterium]|nr:hypothetical protein [Flavobacteriales bacterium]HNI05385.1 hypothetical protein [Flavobacteriales bacterium]HNK69845.1 hypothetical protein [Flavobacteriales bacterium]HNO06899.1 hypothetical protein [Flavobacteriales bacterium]